MKNLLRLSVLVIALGLSPNINAQGGFMDKANDYGKVKKTKGSCTVKTTVGSRSMSKTYKSGSKKECDGRDAPINSGTTTRTYKEPTSSTSDGSKGDGGNDKGRGGFEGGNPK